MIIDANSYWFDERIFHDETLCEQFLAEVPRAYDTEGYLTMNSAGKRQIVIEMPAGSPGLNYIEGDYTLEKRLADMDEAGVDKAILKLPGCHEWMSLEMCRRFNDGMAADAKASSGRLIPLVAVPPFGTKAILRSSTAGSTMVLRVCSSALTTASAISTTRSSRVFSST